MYYSQLNKYTSALRAACKFTFSRIKPLEILHNNDNGLIQKGLKTNFRILEQIRNPQVSFYN